MLFYREYLMENCRQAKELKQSADEFSWLWAGMPCGHSLWLFATQLLIVVPSLVMLSSHGSGRIALHRVSFPALCPTPLPRLLVLANIEHSALWRKPATERLKEDVVSLHTTFDHCTLILYTVHCSIWHPQCPCGKICNGNQKVNRGKSGSQLPPCRWPHITATRLLTFHDNSGLCWTITILQRVMAVTADRNGIWQTGLCCCGETQTMFHIVYYCPLTKLYGCRWCCCPVDRLV